MKRPIDGESVPRHILRNLNLLAGKRGQLSGGKRGRLRALTWGQYHRRGTRLVPLTPMEKKSSPWKFYNATHKQVPVSGSWKFIMGKLKEIDTTDRRTVRLKTKRGCLHCKHITHGGRHMGCGHGAHGGMEVTWGGHPCKFFERGEEE